MGKQRRSEPCQNCPLLSELAREKADEAGGSLRRGLLRYGCRPIAGKIVRMVRMVRMVRILDNF